MNSDKKDSSASKADSSSPHLDSEPSANLNNESFSHLDDEGKAQMVDVGNKEKTQREAKAIAKIIIKPEVIGRIKEGSLKKGDVLKSDVLKKGDVLAVARIAGIQAAKKTSELIPLCHPLMLGFVGVDFELNPESIQITSTAKTLGQTGVEMEALTACSVAALTIYDMCKSLDKSMQITQIQLIEKTGGSSGDYLNPAAN